MADKPLALAGGNCRYGVFCSIAAVSKGSLDLNRSMHQIQTKGPCSDPVQHLWTVSEIAPQIELALE